MPKPNLDIVADMLKAVGHPVRLEIVRELARRENCCCGDMCGCFSLSQSTVSQHLSVLKEAGILAARKVGNRSVYQLNPQALAEIQSEFGEILSGIGGSRDG